MQAKDIPDAHLLEFLADRQGEWTMSWDLPEYPDAHPKVMRAKVRALHRRGLIGGCPCGCRGDFEITDKGLALIGRARTKPYTGY